MKQLAFRSNRSIAPAVHQLPPGQSLRLRPPGFGPGSAAPPLRPVGRLVLRCRHAPLILRQVLAEDRESSSGMNSSALGSSPATHVEALLLRPGLPSPCIGEWSSGSGKFPTRLFARSSPAHWQFIPRECRFVLPCLLKDSLRFRAISSATSLLKIFFRPQDRYLFRDCYIDELI